MKCWFKHDWWTFGKSLAELQDQTGNTNYQVLVRLCRCTKCHKEKATISFMDGSVKEIDAGFAKEFFNAKLKGLL